MPSWLLLTVMALAVYRATRLLTKDTFPPVLWLRDRLSGGWRPLTEPEMAAYNEGSPTVHPASVAEHGDGILQLYVVRAAWSPYWLAELVSCPWCASGWITGALTLVTDLVAGLPDPWLVGPAVWGAAALLASRSWA